MESAAVECAVPVTGHSPPIEQSTVTPQVQIDTQCRSSGGHPKRRRKAKRKHFSRRKNDERRRLQAKREGHAAQEQDRSTCTSPNTIVTFKESGITDVTLPQNWLAIPSDEDTLQWSRLEIGPSGLRELTESVLLKDDLTWSVFIHGRKLPATCKLFASFLSTITTPAIVTNLLRCVHYATLCPGNPDECFITLMENRGGSMKKGDNIIAYIDNTPVIGCDGQNYPRSVRRVECDLLCLRTGRNPVCCQACQPFRSSLRTVVSRSPRGDNTLPSSHTSFSNLTPAEKNQRMKNLHQSLKAEKKHSKRLEMKVKQFTEGKMSEMSSQPQNIVKLHVSTVSLPPQNVGPDIVSMSHTNFSP